MNGVAGDRQAATRGPVPAGRLGYLLVLLLLAALAAQVLPPLIHKSGVCDEQGAHLPSGYIYWKSGVFSGGINNPPLMQVLTAAPLALAGFEYSPFSETGIWAARLPVLALSLGLGLAVFAWARSLYGLASGLAALFLFCFEPNVLAHSGLATLDLGVTAFLFAAFFFLWRAWRFGGPANWIAACAAMALALLSKFTALFLLPVFLFLLAAVLFRGASPRTSAGGENAGVRRGGTLRSSVSRAAAAVGFFALLFVILSHVLYHVPAVSGGFLQADSPDISAPPSEESPPMRAGRLLLPDMYMDGALGKLQHSAGGHFAYLTGKRSLRGWWYYFPVALSLKTPIPFLVAFALAVVLGALVRRRATGYAFLLLPMVCYVCAMAWTGVNIGVRHVLFFYPVAAVAASGLLEGGLPRRRPLLLLMAAGAAWHLAGTIRIHPHYLAYFNEAAGGPMGGPRYLIDSNIDWGQDDNMLLRFIADQHDTVLVNPGPFAPSVGTIAVNVNSIHGILRGDDSAYGWLRQFKPRMTLGYTWYVYELTAEDFRRAAGLSGSGAEPRFWLATALQKEGRLDEALSELRNIEKESPDLGHRALTAAGRWLLKARRYDEAIRMLHRVVEAGGGPETQAALEMALTESRWAQGTAETEDLTALGRLYSESGDAQRAAVALEAAMELDPEDAAPKLAMARLLGREGRFPEAAAWATGAASLDPDLTAAREAAREARMLAEAELQNESYEALMMLAQIHYRFRRPSAAAQCFWRAFNLNPSSEEALTAMGDIIVRVKLGVLKPETAWPPWQQTPTVSRGGEP